MHNAFIELSLVILITTGISVIMRLLRQPLILGYILAGLLIGPSALGLIESSSLFDAFSTIGIALLLFIIGLGMNVRDLGKIGKVVIVMALSIIGTVSVIGFFISKILGFYSVESALIGLALFFSSTIIIVKILSDKKEQHRLHGQIAIGAILFDDLVATMALLFIAASKNGGLQLNDALSLLIKGLLLVGVLIIVSIKILPKFIRFVASSQELLFLTAIAWGFGIASLFEYAGFSLEIGALFAGVALASSPFSQEISSRLKPLRDFFVILFFIVLGESMNISNLSSGLMPALILSLVVIIIKPLSILVSMGLLGYSKRVSFKTSINLSQISEFSIIMVVVAVTAGIARPEVSAVITIVAIITIATSTYLMLYDDVLYKKFMHNTQLKLFDRPANHAEKQSKKIYQILLFGYYDGGHEFIKAFKSMNKKYLVIDYDPSVQDLLVAKKESTIFGDATDSDLLEELGTNKTELVVSTFTDLEASKQLISNVRKVAPKSTIINHATSQIAAEELYQAGSDYVIIPHHIGSQKISAFMLENGYSKQAFQTYLRKSSNSQEV